MTLEEATTMINGELPFVVCPKEMEPGQGNDLILWVHDGTLYSAMEWKGQSIRAEYWDVMFIIDDDERSKITQNLACSYTLIDYLEPAIYSYVCKLKLTCSCPKENFSFNGVGCLCGGI